jgi:ABC-type glycerol-3-phosphate transport system substrate-binding protein
MDMARRILILTAVIVVVLALRIVACAPPPTPEVVEKVVKETVVVEKEVPAPEPEVVTFMTWAEDDFEKKALQEMVSRFEETHPGIQVKLEIVTAQGGAP